MEKRSGNPSAVTMDECRTLGILDALPSPICYVDSDRRYRFANKAYQDWVGLSQADLCAKRVEEVLGSPAYRTIREHIDAALAGEEVAFRMILPYRGGLVRHVSARLIPDRTGGGEIPGFTMVFGGVSERPGEESKRTGDSSENQTRLLQSILDSVADGVVVANERGEFVVFNPAAEKMVGIGATDTRPDDWPETYGIFLPDGVTHYPADELPMVRAIRGEDVREAEMFLRNPNMPAGVLISIDASPLRNEKGETKGGVIAFRDVTERKRTDEALRESEKKFRTLAENIQEVFWMVDAETGRLMYVSHAYEEVFGQSCESLYERTRNWSSAIHLDDRESVAKAWLSMPEEGRCSVEYRIIRPDGSIRWLWDRSFSVRDEAGEVWRIVGIAQEITERKQAEEALRESEKLFRTMAENIREVFWMMDAEASRILYVSPGYEEIWGRTCESLYERPDDWLDAIHPSDKEHVLAKWQNEETRGSFSEEYRIIRPDGSARWIWDRSFTVCDEAGEVWRIVGLSQDISERKRTEHMLAMARDEALEAARVKSAFLAAMSHEIRTPLNAVIGMTELLLDTRLTEEQREYAETVDGAGERLLALINEVLDVSKLEAGKMELRAVDFSLREAVGDVVELLARRAGGKGLELSYSVGEDIPEILHGDPDRLRQVLTNLVSNGVKFTKKGSVEIRAKRLEEPGMAVLLRFEVADTGIGIPPRARAKLFQPFIQVENSKAGVYGGTGLGLAISKQLVELMGGEIGVESKPGRGSTFWFTARLEKAPPPRAIRRARKQKK